MPLARKAPSTGRVWRGRSGGVAGGEECGCDDSVYTQMYNDMQFLTLQVGTGSEPAVIVEGTVIRLRDAGFANVQEVITGGADAMDRVLRWVNHAPGGEVFDGAAMKFRAPIHRPGKIICIGLNYRD